MWVSLGNRWITIFPQIRKSFIYSNLSFFDLSSDGIREGCVLKEGVLSCSPRDDSRAVPPWARPLKWRGGNKCIELKQFQPPPSEPGVTCECGRPVPSN